MLTQPLIVSDGEEDSKSGNWLFPGGSEEEDVLQSGEEPTRGTGVLILDGDSTNGDDDDELSYPDSIPTEIMTSLQEDERHGKRMRAVGLIASVLLVVVAALLWDRASLTKQHQGVLHRNLALEEELQQIKDKVTKLEQSKKKQLVRRVEDWNTADSQGEKIPLADNCWFKAELELGECMKDAKESFEDWTTDTTRNFKEYFASASGSRSRARTTNTAKEASTWSMFADATTVASVAASNVMDSMVTLGKKLDDTVLEVVEQSRDAIQDATHFMRKDL